MKRTLLVSLALLSLQIGETLAINPAKMQVDEDTPILFYADEKTYDSELGILILKGNVEFSQKDSVLEADYVTYNENSDIVTASGNVRLRQPDGDIYLAEYMELKGDLKDGFARHLRGLMADDGKIVAVESRLKGDIEEFDKSVYTPCDFCGDHPPVWQINAQKTVKDDGTKDIHFTDAQLRMFDVPLLYTPYLTQPLERRSGFLMPFFGFGTKDTGFNFEVPYYWAISPDKDATFSPVFFTELPPLLKGSYRQAFGNGRLGVNGSFTQKKTVHPGDKNYLAEKDIPKNRWHIMGDGQYGINDDWRWGFKGARSSDPTYLRYYNIFGTISDPALTSKVYQEGFFDRSYFSNKMYSFQAQNTGIKSSTIPTILPIADYHYVSPALRYGSRFNFDANFLNMYRDIGIKMERGIMNGGFKVPYINSWGHAFTFFTNVRTDLYHVEDYIITPPVKSGTYSRTFPRAGIDWRWPFMKKFKDQSLILEPIGQIVGTPNGLNPRTIPNQDGGGFEFTDGNLFAIDRIPGFDQVDSGSRTNYGLLLRTDGSVLGTNSILFGQSYSFVDPHGKNAFQGLGSRASDYVGSVDISPFPEYFSTHYRFRYDKDSWDQRFAEVGTIFGPSIAKISADYIFLDKATGTMSNLDFNQISLKFSSQMTQHWSFQLLSRHDMNSKREGGGILSRGAGIKYIDECFTLDFSVTQNYYTDRDIKPGKVFMLVLGFKNLGTFSQGYNASEMAGPNQGTISRLN
ncbi:LPS assembly protein LptD [Candidatus Bealeia paramacronuclearis]|uniref:LPS-assembly protein LptD n=1 Tax=Candidatus Bealeia paramacronuclearis TaxID=1921001 RepID=A0ABZ2C2Q3_9PROT|nr:LPS assembly protein LptD [Candidatus Bealeia paramacronuclearis]